MVNGLAVLGWGVGGIEAEAAMLGQPISMLIPEVIGFKLDGALPEGTTATDLVLTVTQMLRKKGVVGKFVEFYGPGLAHLSLEDMATIANMAPEYGATCGFFPINAETIAYLKGTARACRSRWRWSRNMPRRRTCSGRPRREDPVFTDTLALDLGTVVPSMAGPKRPQDRVELADAAAGFAKVMADEFKKAEELGQPLQGRECQFRPRPWRRGDRRHHLLHQHLQSQRDDRRRPPGAQCGEDGPHRRSPGSRPRWRPARRW